MREDLNYVAAAREGRIEMLRFIFGSPSKDSLSVSTSSDDRSERSVTSAAGAQPLTPAAFDLMFPSNEPQRG